MEANQKGTSEERREDLKKIASEYREDIKRMIFNLFADRYVKIKTVTLATFRCRRCDMFLTVDETNPDFKHMFHEPSKCPCGSDDFSFFCKSLDWAIWDIDANTFMYPPIEDSDRDFHNAEITKYLSGKIDDKKGHKNG